MAHHIPGIGEFTHRGDFWECASSNISGLQIIVDDPDLSKGAEVLLKFSSHYKDTIVNECISYIESRRSKYGLLATTFKNPSINVMESVTVFFETEVESESVVGVEFTETNPIQLVIGD